MNRVEDDKVLGTDGSGEGGQVSRPSVREVSPSSLTSPVPTTFLGLPTRHFPSLKVCLGKRTGGSCVHEPQAPTDSVKGGRRTSESVLRPLKEEGLGSSRGDNRKKGSPLLNSDDKYEDKLRTSPLVQMTETFTHSTRVHPVGSVILRTIPLTSAARLVPSLIGLLGVLPLVRKVSESFPKVSRGS